MSFLFNLFYISIFCRAEFKKLKHFCYGINLLESLLTNFCNIYFHFQQNKPCLWNFTSSSTGTTCSSSVLQRMCEELGMMLDVKIPLTEDKLIHDYNTLKKYFCTLLKEISKKYPGFPIIIDAINQFKDNWGRAGDWLPVPNDEINVKYVISTISDSGDPNYSILMRKFHNVTERFVLAGLDKPSRISLATTYFSKFNKALDKEQMEALVSLPAAVSPLFLTMACEETRVFGIYENLTRHIKRLPGKKSNIQTMFDKTLF